MMGIMNLKEGNGVELHVHNHEIPVYYLDHDIIFKKHYMMNIKYGIGSDSWRYQAKSTTLTTPNSHDKNYSYKPVKK